MPSIVAMTMFCALTLSCAPWAAAKEDGVPGRRVGGGTRLEMPEKLSRTKVLGSDQQSSTQKSASPHLSKTQSTAITASAHQLELNKTAR